MMLAALAVLACLGLIWWDRLTTEQRVPGAPELRNFRSVTVGRRGCLVAAAALVVLAALTISATYGMIAAVIGLALVMLRRPALAGLASLALVAGLGLLLVRREVRYRLAANPSWPAAFDDMHRLGLLVVVLLLAATLVDECPPENAEPLA
jgi:hypothetical protein